MSPDTCFRKPVIGVTGSIGAGKTLVATFLGQCGCAVIFADELVHRILEEEPTREFVRREFGPEMIGPDGRVDRAKLADCVFQDADQIRRLEEYIHPKVIARQNDLVARYQSDAAVKAVVVEVPLLYESGLNRVCDWVIVVDADPVLRQRRVEQSRGWSPAELFRREKFFFSIYLKRSLADAIVYNNSTIENCRQQVEKIYSRIISSVPCQLA